MMVMMMVVVHKGKLLLNGRSLARGDLFSQGLINRRNQA